MKKTIRFLAFLFTCFALLANSAKASTSIGADLTYVRIGQDSIVVQYKYYRDCSATIQSPTSLPLQYQASGCHIGGSINLILGNVTQGYHFGCPTGNCNTGLPGIFYEQATYSAILVLPAACNNWTLSVTRPDRGASNLDSTATANMYTEDILNNTSGIRNTSVTTPYLHPVQYACASKPVALGGGVTDLDGDSLVFSLNNPLIAANTPHVFKPGFTAVNPLGITSPFIMNPLTGVISVTAPSVAYTRYAFRYTVSEYRRINGVTVMVGQTNRDMMVVIDPCPPKPLIQITNAKQSVDSVFVIAADVNNCLSFNTFEPDSLSILRVTTNVHMALPGATYSVSGGANPVITVCWKPTKKDLYTQRSFQITARNNACPIPQFKTQYIRLWIVKKKRVSDPGPIDVISPQPPALRLAAPNVITPNNDGKNDAFVIQGLSENTELQIIDRNKKVVKVFKKYQNNWNAEGLKNGTYFYILKNHETGEVLKGTVEVIR